MNECNDAPDYIDVYFVPQEEQGVPQSLFVPSYTESFRARIGDILGSSGSSRSIIPTNGLLPSYYVLSPFTVGGTMFGRSALQQSGLPIDFCGNLQGALINKAVVIDQIELYLAGNAFPTIGIDGTRTPPVAPVSYSAITANQSGDFKTVGGALHLNTGGQIAFNPSTGQIQGPNYIAQTNFIYGPGTNLLFAPAEGAFLCNIGDYVCIRLRVKKAMSAIAALMYSMPDAGAGIADFLKSRKAETPDKTYLLVQ